VASKSGERLWLNGTSLCRCCITARSRSDPTGVRHSAVRIQTESPAARVRHDSPARLFVRRRALHLRSIHVPCLSGGLPAPPCSRFRVVFPETSMRAHGVFFFVLFPRLPPC